MTHSCELRLSDVQLHYVEAPGSRPALVILHGITGSHHEFLHLLPELTRHFHVYLLDLRGHGNSAWTDQGYLVRDYAEDVAAFLQQVVGRPAVLLGHSLGGAIALWLAAHQPALLDRIVLSDPALYLLEASRRGKYALFDYFRHLHHDLHLHHSNAGTREDLVVAVGQTLADDERTLLEVAGPAAVALRATQLHLVDPAVLAPLLASILLGTQQIDGLLARVQCPVHLLAATPALGGVLVEEDLRRALAQMPHSTHSVVANAGHDIHLDQPDVLLHELRQFALRPAGTQPGHEKGVYV